MSDPETPPPAKPSVPSPAEPSASSPAEPAAAVPAESAVPAPAESAVPGAVETAVVPPPAGEATDRNPWNWLLFLPIVVPLIPVLFNVDSPRLFGFPRFYWLQLAFIVLGVGTTSVVYQMTKKRR